ncbi:MAG: efflux RND transporter periplasmic adaptor subunit [Vicinamibacterales bacterium]
MKKLIAPIVIIAALAGAAYYAGYFGTSEAPAANQQAGGGGAPGGAPGGVPGAGGNRAGGGAPGRGGAPGGRGGRFGATGPMTVEVAQAKREQMAQQLTVVGNLIGDATVAVVPRTAGRLQEVNVRLGDQVTRGQRIAKIEDQEVQEQVRQAEAAFEVSRATIRQRDADLSLAKTNVERARSLFQRQLLPQQTLDDNEARYQSAIAQLDLSRAQNNQSQARLDELKITLANTNILAPVDGFVARRAVDPGAFVGQNAPVVDVVDIRRVRLVVNVVEKDLKQIRVGDQALVNVDAFPGETFSGRIARVAPVLDATTRTSPIELEIPNPGYRLKPGMYARVSITTNNKQDALVVPAASVVDINGRRGVYLASETGTALFRAVRVGLEEDQRMEILEGLVEGDTVITTGAAGLTDGARFTIAGRGGRNGGGRNGGQGGQQGRGQGRATGQPAGGVQDASATTPPQRPQGGAEVGAAPEGGRRGRRGGADGTGGAVGNGSTNGGEGFRGRGDGTGRRGGRRGGQQGADQPGTN